MKNLDIKEPLYTFEWNKNAPDAKHEINQKVKSLIDILLNRYVSTEGYNYGEVMCVIYDSINDASLDYRIKRRLNS